nr:hypothetical protein [Tanacetum cinerariifolium]
MLLLRIFASSVAICFFRDCLLLRDFSIIVLQAFKYFLRFLQFLDLLSYPRKREPAEKDVKLLTLTEARTFSLNPLAALGDSGDSIDKLFDERNDDVLEESITKDVSEVAAEKTKKKRKKKVVEDASGFTLPPKRPREDHHAASSNIEGKSLAAIRDLVPDGSSVPNGVTEPPTVVFVPLTLNDGPTNFVSGLNLQTCPPSLSTFTANASAVPPRKVRVVSKNLEFFRDSASAGGANVDAAGPSKLNELVDSSDSFYASQDLNFETLYRIYLRAMDYDQLYTEFNVGVAGQICLGEEVRIDTKIAHLKSLLSLKEPEAAKAIRLCGISAIKAADAVKGNELRDLKERNFKSLLKSAFEFFKEHMEATQDEQAKAIGCAVHKGIQDGLRAGVDHGKARKDLSIIEAYDPSAEAKYVEVVNALGIVDFSLLSVLKSKKDTSIVDLMDSLRLDGPLAEIPRAKDLQPSPE